MGFFGTKVGMMLPPRRGAQIIKQAKLEIIILEIVADASHLRNYTKMRYAKLYNRKIFNELLAMAEPGIPLLLAEEQITLSHSRTNS